MEGQQTPPLDAVGSEDGLNEAVVSDGFRCEVCGVISADKKHHGFKEGIKAFAKEGQEGGIFEWILGARRARGYVANILVMCMKRLFQEVCISCTQM